MSPRDHAGGPAGRASDEPPASCGGPSGALARSDRGRKPVILALTVLAAAAFAVHLALGRQFEALGIFFLDDTLFNSDPRSMVDVFGHAQRSISIIYPELRNSIHPYLWLYFGPFIRVLAKLIGWLGLTDLPELQVRVALAVYVSPVISALQTFLFGVLLFALGFSLRQIVAVSVLGLATFSGLVFGAIPEHYVVTSLALTAMALVAVLSLRRARLDRLRVWIPLGLFATSITISNFVPVGIVHAAAGLSAAREPVFRRLAKSAALAVGTFVFVLATAHAVGVAMDGPLPRGSVRDNFVPRYVRHDLAGWRPLQRAAAALANSFAPSWSDIRQVEPTPVPPPYHPSLAPAFGTNAPFPKYTLEPAPGAAPGLGPFGAVALAALALGAVLMLRRGGACRLAAGFALAVLTFNLALHMVWGDEFFVYSQHWMVAALLLAAGVLMVPARLRLATEALFALFVIGVAWNNIDVLSRLLSSARAAAGIAG